MYAGTPLALPPLPFRADAGVVHTATARYDASNLVAAFSPDGNITVEGTCPALLVDNAPTFVPFDIVCTTADGWSVTAHKCLVRTRHFSVDAQGLSSGAFTVYAATLEATRGALQETDSVTVYKLVSGLPDGAMGGEARRADKSFVAADLAPLSLFPARPEDVPAVEPAITGYFTLEGLYASHREWEETFGRLYNLLALASSNFVRFPLSYTRGPAGERVELRPSAGETGRGQSVLYLAYPMTLSKFLNSTYDLYLRWRAPLDLDTLIHYYVLLKNTGYPETRVLLGSVLMEGVKYAYAAHYKQYRRDKDDFFLKQDGKRYSFRALIEEVYDEFGLKHGDTEFIHYRN